MREEGERINHKHLARLMRTIGLTGLQLRRRHCTPVTDPAAAKATDLIGRDLTAQVAITRYVGDITYLPLVSPAGGGKFLYLATVIDLASRRPAGWAIADRMRAELVIGRTRRSRTMPQQPGRGLPAHRPRPYSFWTSHRNAARCSAVATGASSGR